MADIALSIPAPGVHPGTEVTVKMSVTGELEDNVQEARLELVRRLTYSVKVRTMSVEEARRRRANGESYVQEERIERRVSEQRIGEVIHFFPDDMLGEREVAISVPADAAPTAEPLVGWSVRGIINRKLAGDENTEVPLRVLQSADRITQDIASPAASEIDVHLDSPTCGAGEVVSGRFSFSGEDVKARKVVAALRMHTYEPALGETTAGVAQVEFDGGTLDSGEWTFELPMPPNAPPSFTLDTPDGRIGISWDVEGKLDRRLRGDMRGTAALAVYSG
jgi:hypothetical protein